MISMTPEAVSREGLLGRETAAASGEVKGSEDQNADADGESDGFDAAVSACFGGHERLVSKVSR